MQAGSELSAGLGRYLHDLTWRNPNRSTVSKGSDSLLKDAPPVFREGGAFSFPEDLG